MLLSAILAATIVFSGTAYAADFNNSDILEKYYKVRAAELEKNKHDGPMKSLQELRDFTEKDIENMRNSMVEEAKDIPVPDDKKEMYVDYLIREAREKTRTENKQEKEILEQGMTPIRLSEMATWIVNMELYMNKIDAQVSANQTFMTNEQKAYNSTVQEFKKYRHNQTYTKQRQLDIMNKWDKESLTEDKLKELRKDIDNVHNGLIFPVESRNFTSHFGWRTDPINKARSFHSGTDIAAPSGSKVKVIEDGIITFTGYHESAGNYIKVRHNNGMYSRYLHLSKILVKEGQKVVQGEVIGLVGNTGRSTGPHLHFEIRDRSNAPLNAMSFYTI